MSICMKVISFIQDGHQMTSCEVELSLTSGLPRVEFTGLADPSIKESTARLKTAFMSQGFSWPNKKQIIINLRPAHIKKTSQGLDLAIACLLLWKTNQISLPPFLIKDQPCFIYGEVALDGRVSAPRDWVHIDQNPILTGKVDKKNSVNDFYCIETLKEISKPIFVKSEPLSQQIKKPQVPQIQFSEKSSLLLEVCASGEHSMLLAGEPGSGKTTLARHILCLLNTPIEEDFKTAKRIADRFGENLKWRPFISPHHSTPPLSIIGGGFPPFMGEISKAHGGILFLDEYLEFQYKVQEALREPIERGEICISRRGEGVNFPAKFILIAATNLCPCGSYVPGENFSCSYSLRKCRSHLDRLSGPMLDRFDILALSSFWKGPLSVKLVHTKEKIEKAFEMKQKRKQEKPNGQLSWDELKENTRSFILNNIMPSPLPSYRRKTAILRVARTIADLNQRKDIIPQDVELSTMITLKPFNQIRL